MVRTTFRQPHRQTRLIHIPFQHRRDRNAALLESDTGAHRIVSLTVGAPCADLPYSAPSCVMRRFQQEIFQNKAALATFQRSPAAQAHEFPIRCDGLGFDAHNVIGRIAIWTIEARSARCLACRHASSPTEISCTTKRPHQRCSFTSARLPEPGLVRSHVFNTIIGTRCQRRMNHKARRALLARRCSRLSPSPS